MRSREMIAKLDRLETGGDDDEIKIPDISLLSPEDQDRARHLMELAAAAYENGSSDAEMKSVIDEFNHLVRGLPLLGRDDEMQGQWIEVPHDLATYWTWKQPAANWRSYCFYNLSKVQTLRFIELCKQYGYESGLGRLTLKSRMIPLSQWQADDQEELRELLEIVGSSKPPRF